MFGPKHCSISIVVLSLAIIFIGSCGKSPTSSSITPPHLLTYATASMVLPVNVAMTNDAIAYQGTEGELYDVEGDLHQWHNRWDDPAYSSLRDDLVADLYDSLPKERKVLKVERPA